ncbi:DUF2235 domain-containing protein [Pseudooceanicola algae]|uniref:T6SS Phospholipase effector Tle1-like catalytic domain-containing protein n=1 Tax=Pseudooceanicola algae TaxID=1537215 RepID=A0A418SAT8_9RHOB|nr:DUF2235 domain-containing protein [Pseudooceanicola algae]QPM91231.1 hypothetical protein PSAL_024820 [Pseudooceanicola algae]
MAKDIVILLDGTSNEIARKRSNVLRLYGCLAKGDSQVVWYDPGVGTFGDANAWSRVRRKISEVWGMATGHGMDQNVKEAYRFLCETYEHGEKDADGNRDSDRIWIFGFSRGAYAARVLAGFVHAFGLIRPVQFNLLDYAYRAYKAIGERSGDAAFAEIRLHERALQPQRVSIEGMGLMDTVASVIEPGRFGPRLASHAYSNNNPSVRALRHAVAIDERRCMYHARLWGEEREYRKPFAPPGSGEPQDVKELWFAGVHGDIGGGYPEAESQLGKLPLDWLIRETAALGLAFNTRTVNAIVLGTGEDSKYVPPVAGADQHVSLSWPWWILEVFPSFGRDAATPGRRVLGMTFPLGAYRPIPDGAAFHPSVAERMRQRPEYRPPNLPGDLGAASVPAEEVVQDEGVSVG